MKLLRGILVRPLLLGWMLGIFTCAGIGGLVAALIVFGGLYDVSAKAQHTKVVAWAVHTTMIHSVKRRAPDVTGLPKTASFWSGAAEYETHCLSCHGGPGVSRAAWTKGMLPTPPFLVDAPSRWSRADLYKIVHDGVKMTGMPAWSEVDDDRRISDVVAFVQAVPKLTPTQFQQAMKAVRSRADSAPRPAAYRAATMPR